MDHLFNVIFKNVTLYINNLIYIQIHQETANPITIFIQLALNSFFKQSVLIGKVMYFQYVSRQRTI